MCLAGRTHQELGSLSFWGKTGHKIILKHEIEKELRRVRLADTYPHL
jgi:hypothetical protein